MVDHPQNLSLKKVDVDILPLDGGSLVYLLVIIELQVV